MARLKYFKYYSSGLFQKKPHLKYAETVQATHKNHDKR